MFFVVFDSREGHGGLFVEARAHALESYDQVSRGHKVLEELKQHFYGVMGGINSYLQPGGQRIYIASPIKFWVNKSQRDQSGAIMRDRRYQIPLNDLLQ